MNPTANQNSTLNNDEFIEEINKNTNQGVAFCPIIGSGISYPSGIMTGKELHRYLAYVLYRRLEKIFNDENNRISHPEESVKKDFDLVRYGWPDPPTTKEQEEADKWLKQAYHYIACKYVTVTLESESSTTQINVDGAFNNIAPCSEHWPPGIKQSKALNDIAQSVFEHFSNNYKNAGDKLDTQIKNKIKTATQEKIKFAIKNKIVDFKNQKQNDNGCFDFIFEPHKGISRSSSEFILEAAIRSMCDWRILLQFHARLTINGNAYQFRSESDHAIIDGLHVFITKGRKPNLSHYVLVYLTAPLNITKILTTNFDNLTESAFQAAKHPLAVYSVERNSRLPDAVAVAQQTSLIKLHGSLHETRADHTLDTTPDLQEKTTFLNYVDPDFQHGIAQIQHNLIAIGYSFQDKRTLELVKYVLDCNKNFKLYYITYSENSSTEIFNKFGKSYKKQIIITHTKRLDLLLLKCYTKLTKSLPPGGFTHQYTQYVPPEFNDEPGNMSDEEESNLLESLTRQTPMIVNRPNLTTNSASYLFTKLEHSNKQPLWFEADDYENAFTLITDIFRSLSIQNGVFHSEHIDIDFISIGEKHSPKVKPRREDKKQNQTEIPPDTLPITKEIESKIKTALSTLRSNPLQTPLFINRSNIHGLCAGWLNLPRWNETRSIISEKRTSVEISEMEIFDITLRCLRESFNVIHFGWPKHTNQATISRDLLSKEDDIDANSTFNQLKSNKNPTTPTAISKEVELLNRLNLNGDAEYQNEKLINLHEKLKETLNYIDEKEKSEGKSVKEILLRTLYTLTLFRESRNASAFFSSSIVLGSNFLSRHGHYTYYTTTEEGMHEDLERKDLKENISKFIEDAALKFAVITRKKHSGFLWMDGTDRLVIQELLSAQPLLNKQYSEEGSHKRFTLKSTQSEIHYELAEWYAMAFFATNHADPLISSIYHRIQCFRSINVRQSTTHLGNDKIEKGIPVITPSSLSRSSDLLRIQAIHSITKLIIESKNSLRFWMTNVRARSLLSPKSIINGLISENEHPISQRLNNESLSDHFNKFLDSIKVSEEEFRTELKLAIHFLMDELFRLHRDISQETTPFDLTEQDKKEVYRPSDLENEASFAAALSISGTPSKLPNAYDDDTDWLNGLEGLTNLERSPTQTKTLSNLVFEAIKDRISEDVSPLTHHDLTSETLHLTNDDIFPLLTRFNHNTALLNDINTLFTLCSRISYRARLLYRIAGLKRHIYYARDETKKNNSEIQNHTENLNRRYISLWSTTLQLTVFALELTRYLNPAWLVREHLLKIKLLSFRGLALSKLGRFDSAHVLFNQASSITFNLSVRDNQSQQAIIQLRRSEALIEECKIVKRALILLTRLIQEYGVTLRVKDNKTSLKFDDSKASITAANPSEICEAQVLAHIKEHYKLSPIQFHDTGDGYYTCELNNSFPLDYKYLYKILLNKIERSICTLDNAEELLSGHSHSRIWWNRLYTQRFSILSTYYVPKPIYTVLSYSSESPMEIDSHNSADQSERLKQRLLELTPVSFRLKSTDPAYLLSLIKKALSVTGQNDYQTLCLCNVYMKAVKQVHRYHKNENTLFNKKLRYPNFMQQSKLAFRNHYGSPDMKDQPLSWKDALERPDTGKESSNLSNEKIANQTSTTDLVNAKINQFRPLLIESLDISEKRLTLFKE